MSPKSRRQTVHPLFDESSFYRLATRESVFSDGGVQSIKDFFAALARQDLHEEWQRRIPPEPQRWGFVGVSDKDIHEFLRGNVPVPVPVPRAHRLFRPAIPRH